MLRLAVSLGRASSGMGPPVEVPQNLCCCSEDLPIASKERSVTGLVRQNSPVELCAELH